MRVINHYIALALLLISGVSLGAFEYVLEHNRPEQIEGLFNLYHKGYGTIVYVSTTDQLIYWGLSMACIASALFLAFRAFNRVAPLA